MADGAPPERDRTPKDPVRVPGDGPLQYIQGQNFAGLGTSFRFYLASQGDSFYKTGVFGGESIDAKPIFVLAPSETLNDSQVNAQIVMGPYKPRGRISKRMAQGQKGVATIDLVAGRMGSYATSTENDEDLDDLKFELARAEAILDRAYNEVSRDDDGDGDGKVDSIDFDKYLTAQNDYNSLKIKIQTLKDRSASAPVFCVNNYKVDSARVVICQKGDVDMDFGIRPARVGTSKSRSFVALKGDDVRIIAREGIKLVTGTDDENSQGGRIEVPRGIDLVAGNNDQDMQPLVKGTSLLECLDDMNSNISDLNGIVMDFLTQQLVFNTAMGFHTHQSLYDPITGTPLSVMVPGIATTFPSFEAIGAYATFVPMALGTTFFSILGNKINCGANYFKYLIPKPFIGDKFICSKHNHTN